MRNIGNFESEDLAKRFSLYLKKKGVENVFEKSENKFEIWIYNEDEILAGKICLEEFEQNPLDPKFDVSMEDLVKEKIEEIDFEKDFPPFIRTKPFRSVLTLTLFITCLIIYLFNVLQLISVDNKERRVVRTKVETLLFYDSPAYFEKMDLLIKKYDKDENWEEKVSDELKGEKLPFLGFYPLLIDKIKGQTITIGSMFEKISEGQVWRVLSPSFLHRDFLHLLFNMLWLWVLGRQIEEKLTRFRYLFLVLFFAVFSNTAQYLMGGPFFLGYSGVVTGMAGFIWSRQKMAPWEGYPLQKPVIYFLAIFILSTSLLQLVSFVMQIFGSNFSLGFIANTAHISGALAGIALGRLPLFAWRGVER